MIQLLLLAAGVIYIFRAGKVRRMTLKDMQGMSADEFQKWQDLQVRSYYWFSGTVWGVSLLSLVVFRSINAADQAQMTIAAVFHVLLLLGGLIVHAVYNDKAKKMKLAFMQRQGIKFVE